MSSRMNRPWALISGASSGFGEATAMLLASRGWNLLLTSRRSDRLEEVAEACRNHGAKVHIASWDIRDREATDAGVAELMKRSNVGLAEGQTPLHALVNNAGLAVGKGPFDEGLDDDWNRMLDTNVKGLLFLARACVAFMRGGSRMVNMGSIAGKQVYSGGNVYCASKHAVDALSQAMRIDLVDRGIGVSQVCPGAAETEFSLVRFKGDQAAADSVYEGFEPLLARDIAEAVEFILSRPPHVNVNDLVIMPTAQASAHHLIRS
ncbi:MAG: SDR family NAD(P)-dependent oxidoreductase [Flavobacteriales bacterium]